MLDLTRKPWEASGEEFPKSIYLPRGMVGPEERRSYYWLAKHYLSGAGVVVDAGAYLGASGHAFAAGAAAGDRAQFNNGPIIHSYDYFKVIDEYVKVAISRDFRSIEHNESYLDIFEHQTAEYADLIQTYPGDFHDHKWSGEPIEILFIDVAKTQTLNSHAIGEFFPSLIPGRSLVIHQDYCHCWHPYIHIGMEYFSDEFELLDEHILHQSRLWRLVKPLAPEKVERMRTYAFTRKERFALLDRLAEKSSESFRPMIDVVRIWEMCRDKNWDGARSGVKALRSMYDVDSDGALWAKQCLQVEARIEDGASGIRMGG